MHLTPESSPAPVRAPSPSVRAPAKLNLGLHVLARRPDGYHDLDTVFLPLGWHDTLRATPADGLVFSASDPALDADAEGNLVVKAARALAAHAGVEPRAALHLDKRIPYGAGLGGGSSDAAAALRALAALWRLDVPEADLHRLAAGLGSDVPFFLDPRPMRGTGRGEVLAPLAHADGTPYAFPFALAVAVPTVHVSTAEAYRLVRPCAEARADLGAIVASNDLDRWRRELVNDFEAPVVAAVPALGAVRAALHGAGAAYVAMSGSGSAFFGVFEHAAEATAAAEALAHAGHRTWSGGATA